MAQEHEAEVAAQRFRDQFQRLVDEVSKVIVGCQEVIDAVLTCLLCDGHALLEGIPGVGKTLLVNTLADVLDVRFSRIQCTPDLMPADLTGTTILTQEAHSNRRTLEFQKGPVFANIVLADEINRSTPKTQSALLQAMQEQSVSVGNQTYRLEAPFTVLATQNPLEMEGTYPLPEAQLDRFLFKILFPFPAAHEIAQILDRTTGAFVPQAQKQMEIPKLLVMRRTVRQVPVADHVQHYAIQLVLNTHPELAQAPDMVRDFVRYGSSPRGAQALILGGKVRALLEKRFALSRADIKQVAHLALRHRLVLNFEGEAAGLSTDAVIDEILKKTKE